VGAAISPWTGRLGPPIESWSTPDSKRPRVGESLAGVDAAGKVRMEGKGYVRHDGDVVAFRHS
jgi:hypothetical protein